MRKILLISILLLSPLASYAAQLPRYLGSEKKFRSYIYNPNDVYRYVGHYTYQSFVEFEEGETVGTISMGNPTLWLFEHLGNRLFLKPVGENKSETNMTVITNKRVYHFELMAKEAKGINDKDLVFVVKFVYPDEKDKNIVEFPKSPASDEPDMRDLSIYNFNYQYTGEKSIAPVKVFDNGEFTYFQFTKKNAEIPAIFTVDSGGFESLVNFRSAGSYIIVERVAPQFTLRSGSDIVCVYNNTMYTSGAEKKDKTSASFRSVTQQKLNNSPAQSSSNSAPNYPMTTNGYAAQSAAPQNPQVMPPSANPYGSSSMMSTPASANPYGSSGPASYSSQPNPYAAQSSMQNPYSASPMSAGSSAAQAPNPYAAQSMMPANPFPMPSPISGSGYPQPQMQMPSMRPQMQSPIALQPYSGQQPGMPAMPSAGDARAMQPEDLMMQTPRRPGQ